MIKELISRNRSYRRFHQDEIIARETLTDLVELARLSPSGGNLQPLKFYLSNDAEENAKIFSCLSWAGYLKDWPGPKQGERPSAYIVILVDKTIREEVKHDQGIAAQSILLGAVEKGLGGCIIGSVDRTGLRLTLDIPDHLEISLVIALGKPIETIVLEESKTGNIKYWRDEKGVHHVPKRNIDDLIIP
jgi:nitroreductase